MAEKTIYCPMIDEIKTVPGYFECSWAGWSESIPDNWACEKCIMGFYDTKEML